MANKGMGNDSGRRNAAREQREPFKAGHAGFPKSTGLGRGGKKKTPPARPQAQREPFKKGAARMPKG